MPDEQTPPPATGGTPPPPNPPSRVEITTERLKLYEDALTRLAEIDAANKRVLEEKDAARLKALAEKGEVERALNELREKKDTELKAERERADSLQSTILAEKKANSLNSLLLGRDYTSPHAADQVRQLLDLKLESVRDPATGAVSVREKGTGRPAEEVVATWLGSPEAAHFLKAQQTGGAGAAGTHQTGGLPAGMVPAQTPVEQAYAGWLAQTTAQREQGYAPMGLTFGPGPGKGAPIQ